MPDESVRLVHASGECEIDFGRRELRVLGSAVPVGGRAFEIVEVLARSAGELVTKNELMDRIWPGAIVTENTLQVHAMAIRKALGPYRTLLKTQSGRGYRLLGDWTVRQQEVATPPAGLQRMRVDGESPVTNLPATVTRLVGRKAAVARLRDVMSAYRVVTLTGPGGIGKTSLALKVARAIVGEFPDGAWLVELASLSDPALLPSTAAHVLGLQLGAEQITAELVARGIGAQKLLLVLDNCEHLIATAAEFAEILMRVCPNVTILATSREIFRIDGEYVYRVPPLDVPTHARHDAHHILECSAVELFIARAKALDSEFSSQGEDLAAIATICRHLDGIPLAIEFAAARAATLGTAQVAISLRDRFALLTSGRRIAVPRHRTLRALLDWSYELLTERERLLFRCLAVFSGGFTLDAASAVMHGTGFDPSAVMDGIASLVTKSLVALDNREAAPRWNLLETVRAYVLEKLALHDEVNAVAGRHAAYYRGRFVTHEPDLLTRLSDADLASRIREIDNVRAALDWASSSVGATEIEIALTAAYVPVWLHSGWYKECRERAESALAACRLAPNIAAPLLMQLHGGLGTAMFYMTATAAGVVTNITEALRLAESVDDSDAQLRWLWVLWIIATDTGDFNAARTVAERFASVAHRSGDPGDAIVADRLSAYTFQFGGDHSAADRCIERVLDLRAAPLDLRHGGWFLHDQRIATQDLMARSLWLRGFVEQGIERAWTCLEQATATGNSVSIGEALRLAVVPIALATGDLVAADGAIVLLADNAAREIATYYKVAARCFEGELLIRRSAFSKGTALLSNTLESFGRNGWAVCYPSFQGALAQGLAGLGHLTEALIAVERGLEAAHRGGERWSLAELHRIKGEVLLQQAGGGTASAAEDCFNLAAEVAREQGALFWELRIALSLARLRVAQSREDEAGEVLLPVYARFTEGFATTDLRTARALLDALPGRAR